MGLHHLTLISLLLFSCSNVTAEESRYFRITVVDDQTGRGVPLVELTTVNDVSYYTDSNGVIAFHDPALMQRRVYFKIQSHGYDYPADRFGYRGAAVHVKAGASVTLEIHRQNIAQRLYRVTGAGIYQDSVLTGVPVPIVHPLLNAQVLGSDSVVNAIYRGKLYWFWGDTNRPQHPLGNFHVPGATSMLPELGGLDPALGIDLEYFTDDSGFARPMARMPGEGPTWIDALVVLTDDEGRERMFARYVKTRPGKIELYEQGLLEYSDEEERFVHVCEFPMDSPLVPEGHPVLHTAADGEHIHFGSPFPTTRVRAHADALQELGQYEAFTCLQGEPAEVDRDERGTVRWAWRRGARPMTAKLEAQLIAAGDLSPEEARFSPRDVGSGERVLAHRGSVYWNDYRNCWIMIFCQQGGSSPLGEIWYSEAESLTGPWRQARKVVTHDRYSFYNPKQHPMFDQRGGRTIFFEGTYTTLFSGNPSPTPRYDYNQIMYQLDLDDPRLELP